MSDWKRETVTIVEIDQPFCQLEYGSSPCGAVLGETGNRKCFNTAATCQDRDNYDPAPLTLRFCTSQAGVAQYGAIPSLRDVSISPLQINIGGMDDSVSPFGRRETCGLTFADHLHSDLKVDKYRLERQSGDAQSDGEGYDPYVLGTFWGKWIARNPFHEGYRVRVYEGQIGQPLEEMEVRNYIIDKINGPTEGQVQIECKDLFSLVEDRKAKAPRASRGELASSISDSDTSATLAPSGIGDEEYPSSGWVAINDEAIQFSRSGDELTLNERGALGTTAEEHDEEDKVQIVLPYEAESVPDILEDLLTEYANVPSEFIPKSDWVEEADANIPEAYTAYIAEPTAVEDLVGELAEQAGFTIWPDVQTNIIRIKAIIPPVLEEERPRVTDESWIKEGSFSIQRKPQQRTSQVWVYYGQRNPLEDVDDPTNYASRVIQADLDSEGDDEYGTPSVREVWGRWIPRFGRANAQQAGDRILSRFRDPPFRGSFQMDIRRDGDLSLASPFRLDTDDVQSATGARDIRNMVPIQAFRNSSGVNVKFQELKFFTLPDEARQIFIDDDTNNFNLRTAYNNNFTAEPQEGDEIVCRIADGVVVGSTSTSTPAFDVGDWPEGVDITIIIGSGAFIVGRAGDGGKGSTRREESPIFMLDPEDGEPGGTAFRTEYPVAINNSATIGGGGGGGGGGQGVVLEADGFTRAFAGGGGGAGAGIVFGAGGEGGSILQSGDPSPRDAEDGEDTISVNQPGNGGSGGGDDGQGGDGGDGGLLGTPGADGAETAVDEEEFIRQASDFGIGGDPGNAIDGDSFITFTQEGTILGPRIN